MPTECIEIAPALAEHARGTLADAEAARVSAHLTGCASCRHAAAVVAIVARAGTAATPDLWPRLRSRIAGADFATDIRLRFPAFEWQAAAAIVVLAAAPLLAPEPGRLLAVMLGML